MNPGYLFVLASLAANVASQQFLSIQMKTVSGALQGNGNRIEALKLLAVSPNFWIGVSLGGLCLLFWMCALSFLPISRALPGMALVFLVSPLVESVLTKAPLSPVNITGFFVIAVGVVLSGLR